MYKMNKQKVLFFKIGVDAILIHDYLLNTHPQKAIQDLGITVFSYEMNGISDLAIMLVDKLPNPMPKWCKQLNIT